MKTKMALVLLMVVISGCYRPHWYRANTTYAELKTDSEWCKTQTQIGATREERIEQYERCMESKGYQLRDKSGPSTGEPIRVEQKEGPPIVIDKNTKVYVGIYSGSGRSIEVEPAYKYFHKKDCKQLGNASIEEVTVEKAFARGKTMCPDCFR
jgi:hypothetical protein